ncbi:hypothetical protein [Lysobacter capsici]|uniref:hypothetical protein n=1 Tax=Lysobacter capsici TaxID=435897 RepID=UPI0011DF5268|nr:hypothetical protein [Lysobacter capsici]
MAVTIGAPTRRSSIGGARIRAAQRPAFGRAKQTPPEETVEETSCPPWCPDQKLRDTPKNA